MLFYIDPGTGSMLFTILIGVLGAGIYILRDAMVKLRFLLSGGKRGREDEGRSDFAFFTDSKRYWTIFKPICDEMEKRGADVLYLTASEDDPMLQEKYSYIRTEFAGEGNRAYAKLNMIKADVVLSSTPGLDVYQWKRSRDVKRYVHLPHAPNDITLYRMFGIDYYDVLLLSGEYQRRQIRELEKLRGLPAKEIELVGLPQLDGMRERLRTAPPLPEHPVTVLIAPSWGSSSIFQKYGGKIIDSLLTTPYDIIIRPHPQSFTSEKELIESLMKKYPESSRLTWDRSTDNFETLRRSDILISDFSGVIFDFSLVFDKPVIYADTSFDKGPYDAWWLDEELWTFTILKKLGMQLNGENIDRIGEVIEECLHAPEYKAGREQARAEAWSNIGHSVESIADCLIRIRERILREEKDTEPESRDNAAAEQ